jgi:hypothetical protein
MLGMNQKIHEKPHPTIVGFPGNGSKVITDQQKDTHKDHVYLIPLCNMQHMLNRLITSTYLLEEGTIKLDNTRTFI